MSGSQDALDVLKAALEKTLSDVSRNSPSPVSTSLVPSSISSAVSDSDSIGASVRVNSTGSTPFVHDPASASLPPPQASSEANIPSAPITTSPSHSLTSSSDPSPASATPSSVSLAVTTSSAIMAPPKSSSSQASLSFKSADTSSHPSQTSTSRTSTQSKATAPVAPPPSTTVAKTSQSGVSSASSSSHAPTSLSTDRAPASQSASPSGPASSPAPTEVPTGSPSTPSAIPSSDTRSSPASTSQQTRPVSTPSSLATPSSTVGGGASESTGVSGISTSNNLLGNGPSSTGRVSETITSNGHTIVTAPSSITVVSTGTAPDGKPIVTTAVIPNGINTQQAISESGFFDNRKAVAGVFVAVALAVIAIIGTLVVCCKRRAKRRRRSMIFPGDISHPRTTYQDTTGSLNDGLVDLGSPRMGSHRRLISPSLASADGGASIQHSQASHFSNDAQVNAGRAGIGALGLSGMRTNTLDSVPVSRQMMEVRPYAGPFSDYHQVMQGRRDIHPQMLVSDGNTIGMAVTSGMPPPRVSASRNAVEVLVPPVRAPSPAPSTPSLYPPSLPPAGENEDEHEKKSEEDVQFYEKEMRRPPSIHPIRPLRKAVHFNESPPGKMEPQDPFADPIDDLFYLEPNSKPSKVYIPPPRIDTRVLFNGAPLTPPDSSLGESSVVTTPSTSHSSDSGHDSKATTNPFASAFIGRPVVGKIEPWARPPRNPLRAASVSRPGSGGFGA